MPKKVLITGVTGFAGSHLAEHIAGLGSYKIYGTYLNERSLENVAKVKDSIELYQIDLTQKDEVISLLEKTKPDLVFHLAAFASPSDSFTDPASTIINNVLVQINVLEAIRKASIKPRILIVSSADIYGLVSQKDLPIDENTKFMPTNPYAVSKITQDYLGLQYFISYNLDIIRVRSFNHIGPRQSPHFVVAAFAKKIAEVEKDPTKDVIGVGDLSSQRDFTDVRDIVVAYHLLLEKGKAGEVYNVGTGVAHSISEILSILLKLSSKKITPVEDPKLIRPSNTPVLLSNIAKIQKEIGWKPTIPLEKTLEDTLDYWRAIV